MIVAEKIRVALNRPFDLPGQRLHVSSSIGIAIHPQHGDDGKLLLRHADDAMYGAKKHGGNRLLMTSLPVPCAVESAPREE